MTPLFQIPGNIKQSHLPFQLDPNSNNSINNPGFVSSPSLQNAKPQMFTFRNASERSKLGFAGVGQLNICPSTIKYIDDDLMSSNLKTDDGSQIDLETIFNQIPGIQIREYLPDTKLDQVLNFFADMFESMKKLLSNDDAQNTEGSKEEKEAAKEQARKNSFNRVMACLKHAFNYVTGIINPNLYSDIKKEIEQSWNTLDYSSGSDASSAHLRYMYDFPYFLYYKLQSAVTTNIYELPCNVANKTMYSADGSKGWPGAGIDLGGIFSKIPVIGDILNSIVGNIRISFMPWWDSKQGSSTAEPAVEIKLDLFNDTIDAALMNFIFVNTIVPGNKWVQYNMFQHSSDLYDIKIEGYNRLFCCSGKFNVNYKGTLRDPSNKFIDILCSKYAGTTMDKNKLREQMYKNKLVKIPDIYEISMSFQSLLPANFNNYLYTIAKNDNIYEDTTKFGYQQAGVKVITTAVEKFVDDMKKYIADQKEQMLEEEKFYNSDAMKERREDAQEEKEDREEDIADIEDDIYEEIDDLLEDIEDEGGQYPTDEQMKDFIEEKLQDDSDFEDLTPAEKDRVRHNAFRYYQQAKKT